MDLRDLEKVLIRLNIPKDSYSIEEVADEALYLILDGLVWCVFYSERGRRTEPEYFSNKNNSCNYFLIRVKKELYFIKEVNNFKECVADVIIPSKCNLIFRT